MKELTIQENQQAALEVLKAISQICEKEHLTYCLCYGTLIGAIRHQGMIPWDDDVDIMMPRKDHDKLMEYFIHHPDEYPHLQFLSRETCSGYPYMISRVSDCRYAIEVENEAPYGCGVFVDVYPLDGLGPDEKAGRKLAHKGDRLSSFCYQSTRLCFEMGLTQSIFRKIVKYPVYLYSKFKGVDYWQDRLQQLVDSYDYDDSKLVCCLTWVSGESDIFYKKDLEETILVPFEDIECRVPKEYHQVLSQMYGDYMQLPPKEEQVGHHFYKTYRVEDLPQNSSLLKK